MAKKLIDYPRHKFFPKKFIFFKALSIYIYMKGNKKNIQLKFVIKNKLEVIIFLMCLGNLSITPTNPFISVNFKKKRIRKGH
jgi:hypothetical protein